MTGRRKHSIDSTSTNSTPRNKSDLWKNALEKDLGDGVIIQMCGLGSANHVVYARMKPSTNTNGDSAANNTNNDDGTSHAVSLGKVIEVLVDQGWRHIAKSILEQGVHIEADSYPSASQLLHLGAVWILNETLYAKGDSAHAKRLSPKDEGTVPDWEDMTLRVHYVPERFYAGHEVDWGKYCRGMLLDASVVGVVGGERVHVPVTGLPDKKDGVIVYENEDIGFTILNKPGGVPINSTLSNHAEDVVSMYTASMKERQGSPESHTPHVSIPLRIETETCGLTLASTRKEFCAYMTKLLESMKHVPTADTNDDKPIIQKLYRCLVCIRDPNDIDRIEKMTGKTLEHYVDPKSATPKRFVRHKPTSPESKMQQCLMRITSVGDEKYRAACVSSKYSDSNDCTLAHRLWNPHVAHPAEVLGVSYVMQLEVELLNEAHRPHQLRGQLAALGCPIVGDEAYGGGVCEMGAHRHTWNRMAVQLCKLEFPLPEWRKEEVGEGAEKKVKKVLVPTEQRCEFRLGSAWWSEYLVDYERYL
ncbi:hypothetical protein HJC23_008222 [Cyclotella cryptica]|uniref:Pseudouridine synthase RsuA/RluA-like domain-containing protein n=1 Tax=Cyclotella cryptica TaxID=29204 RepID=A0ABD3QC49_9STRA|eukprot:CCRYP_008336-RA/>CCRYP_008336-RA protein AED:0.06 eAED:0.06 QI:200/1/1/1/1/1/3/364/530